MPVHVKKVSVALGHEELAWAQRRARREGVSVSAVLTDAARRAREAELREAEQRRAWAGIVAWVTNGAPFSPEEIAAVDRELADAAEAGPPARARRKRRAG